VSELVGVPVFSSQPNVYSVTDPAKWYIKSAWDRYCCKCFHRGFTSRRNSCHRRLSRCPI